MEKFHLETDSLTGETQYFVWDEDNDTFHIEYEFECSDLLEFNKHLRNNAGTKWGEMAHVASIPLNLYYDLKQKGIIDDQAKFKAWLNDPEQRYFRTRNGTV